MANKPDGTVEAKGLWRHPNDLNAPEGSLSVADEAVIFRDNVIDRRRGYSDCSTNLPNALPEQLFTHGDNIYLHMDGKIYQQDGDCSWSNVTSLSNIDIYGRRFLVDGTNIFLNEDPTYFQQRHSIRKLDLVARFVSTLAGTSVIENVFPTAVDGAAFVARFSAPGDITIQGNYIYVADFGSSTVRRINKSSGLTDTFAGVINTPGNVDGVGAAARFRSVQAICSDSAYLWVLDVNSFFVMGFFGADTAFKRIEIATQDVVTIAASAYTAPFPKGFYGESGWTATGHDYCYFTNNSDFRYGPSSSDSLIGYSIVRIHKTTGVVDKEWSGLWATSGYANGNAGASRYYRNKQIWGDLAEGYLYVCDWNNHVIRKVALADGSSTLYAGTPGVAGTVDGIGAAAKFDFPAAIGGDATTIWVADRTTIRTIDRATTAVTTYAFTDGNGFNGPISYDVEGPP